MLIRNGGVEKALQVHPCAPELQRFVSSEERVGEAGGRGTFPTPRSCNTVSEMLRVSEKKTVPWPEVGNCGMESRVLPSSGPLLASGPTCFIANPAELTEDLLRPLCSTVTPSFH